MPSNAFSKRWRLPSRCKHMMWSYEYGQGQGRYLQQWRMDTMVVWVGKEHGSIRCWCWMSWRRRWYVRKEGMRVKRSWKWYLCLLRGWSHSLHMGWKYMLVGCKYASDTVLGTTVFSVNKRRDWRFLLLRRGWYFVNPMFVVMKQLQWCHKRMLWQIRFYGYYYCLNMEAGSNCLLAVVMHIINFCADD